VPLRYTKSMVRGFLTAVKRFILWDYARTTWQFDLIVGLILIFLFLTPREWFHDQPRIPKTSKIAMLQGSRGTNVYWIETELLESFPEPERIHRAAELLKSQTGEKQTLFRLEPVFDSEHEAQGYMAFTRP